MVEILPDDLEPAEGSLYDAWIDTGQFTHGLTTPDRDDNVLTGSAREVYDWVFDYQGTWGGQTDQHDIHGPSIDPRDGENWIDWRNEGENAVDESDPLRRLLMWIVGNPGKVIAIIVFLYALPLFASLLDLLANATEGA